MKKGIVCYNEIGFLSVTMLLNKNMTKSNRYNCQLIATFYKRLDKILVIRINSEKIS